MTEGDAPEESRVADPPASGDAAEGWDAAQDDRTDADDNGDTTRFGTPGRPVNRGHPFYVGFVGALGVLIAWGLVQLIAQLSSVLTLVAVALFLSLGLDPVVQALQRRGLGRGVAVAIVFVGVIGVFVGFGAAVVPTLISQAGEFANNLPDFLDSLLKNPAFKRLDEQYGIITNVNKQLTQRLSSGETVVQLFGGVFGAGKAVLSGFFSAFTVLVLTLYFLASLRGITEMAYRMVPSSRRARVRLLSDEIIRRIGGYVAGQLGVASMNAVCTFLLLSILGIPYRLVLALSVGLFGLIPLVGATIGALLVTLVALFQSWQLAVIVVVYYLVYQQVENYLIVPRVMARTVAVPGAVALVAALAGGTLLGVLGALIAIPLAAGILLIVQEVVVPRQEAL